MCKTFFKPLVNRIVADGPKGSVTLAKDVNDWVEHTNRCKVTRTCPYPDKNCIDCLVVSSLLSATEREHLRRNYL